MSARRRTRALIVAPVVVASLALAGCTGAEPSDAAFRTAELVVQVTEVHEATGMTLLEGPVITPDGELLVVDVTAPPGEPSVLRIDLDDAEVSAVSDADGGAYTSAQISPLDGRLYLTDFATGSIVSMTTDGDDRTVFFAGQVEGTAMNPDDIAFSESGDLYITDSLGYGSPYWAPQGRIVRIDESTAEATVVARDLAAPNGISFDLDDAGLWVSNNGSNQVDYLRLSDDGGSVTTAHPAIRFDGGTSQIDSNAVDADGNLYQAVHGQPSIVVYSPTGEHLTTVSIPDDVEGLSSATNIAIAPGTTDAYMTVSGTAGGFVYSFEALAEGIRQSNGG